MRKIFPILLMGCLSMLFAEVFSGASQTWFVEGWGLLVTFPLYLAHVMFFLWIALKFKKTSLSQLYFLGVIFALYESWITKVLWAGYFNSAGPGLGTLFGIGIPEFPILVFFWHPVMSFILPILIFEILTKKALIGHERILRRSTGKTMLIMLFSIAISAFIANGNQFSLVSSNISVLGTMLLVLGFHHLSGKTDLRVFRLKKAGVLMVSAYLALLYLGTFFFLLPERIPTTIMPYISILVFYFVVIFLITKSRMTETKFTSLNHSNYSIGDLLLFAAIMIFAVNMASVLPSISSIILIIAYFMLAIIGSMIFALGIYKTIKKIYRDTAD